MFGSVQALRGIAALLVVMFHASTHLDERATMFRFGNAGVDIFFVISGFVMWTVTTRRPTGPAAFLRHRFIRLVPLYWFFTLLLVFAFLAHPATFARLQITLPHVLLSLAFIPHTGPGGGEMATLPVLGQGWTLNFEMFFYLLFAASLALPSTLQLRATAACLVALSTVGFILPASADAPLATLLRPLLLEFLAGILIARLVAAGWRPAAPWCWASVALGVAIFVVFPTPEPDDDVLRLLQYGVSAVLLVGGAIGAELAGTLPIGRVALLLGGASYSIYLSHTFVISVLGKVLPPSGDMAFTAAATVGAALVGVVVFILIERPLLSLMRGKPTRRPVEVAGVSVR